MTLPNFITLARIFAVPVIVWLLVSQSYLPALLLFLAAGLSDALDGFIAKRFNSQSELGTYLDPLADKIMLVAIYVVLGEGGHLAPWLVILVVSRDVAIVGAVLLSWVLGKPVAMDPHIVSKANTVMQIVLAITVLASLALVQIPPHLMQMMVGLTGLLTALSLAVYLRDWLHHMANGASGKQP